MNPITSVDVELDIFLHICRSAFCKWKKVCIRHVEDLSLMESYQDVKREGTATLTRWLGSESN